MMIPSSKIKSIASKFIYKGDKLMYQIVLNMYDGNIYHEQYDSYENYQITNDQLIESLNLKKNVDISHLVKN